MYKPHLFAEILSQKSRVRLIHETIALKGSKLRTSNDNLQKLTLNALRTFLVKAMARTFMVSKQLQQLLNIEHWSIEWTLTVY